MEIKRYGNNSGCTGDAGQVDTLSVTGDFRETHIYARHWKMFWSVGKPVRRYVGITKSARVLFQLNIDIFSW